MGCRAAFFPEMREDGIRATPATRGLRSVEDMLQNGSAAKSNWVVIYARVSSKEQEIEGFSIRRNWTCFAITQTSRV
jgi:hypothetical protein